MGFYHPKVQQQDCTSTRKQEVREADGFPGAGRSCNAWSVLSLPGGWMKMERSFYLKKRRADFVAGYLKGRVVVAGGLGEALRMVVTI